MPHMTSVSLGIWIGVGGRYEAVKESGISHIVEHMVFKGTHTRTAKELKESIEGVGGAFNGFTSDEVTCYMVKVPAKYVKLGVDILSDMVLNAKFDKKDLAKEKFVVCEEIKMYKDQPAEHVLDILGEIMWPDNALGRPLTGSISTVKGMTAEQISKFKEASYHPENIAIVASGNMNASKFFEYASKKFEGQKKCKRATFRKIAVSQKKPRIKICKGLTNQTHIAMGFHAEDANMQDRFAIKLMNVIFGGNMSSRLFEELREKYGLCYDISSSYKRHSDVGEFHVHAGVDNKKAAQSVVAILDEMKKLRDLGVTDDELERAKKYTKGQFLLAMERTSTRMLWLGDRTMVHKKIPKLKDVIKKIDAVTGKEVQEAAKNIFKSNVANLAMISNIGPKDKARIRKEVSAL